MGGIVAQKRRAACLDDLEVETERDLNALLADLRRQRKEVDARIASSAERSESAADLVARLQKLRERAERTHDDETLRIKR